MSDKHAYLIMAHDQYNILCMLLKDIDDERNDIFLHLDKKSKNIPWKSIKKSVCKSNLYIVKQKRVNWGGYSQIDCEIHLLENAKEKGKYQYYHFLCGTEYPIKSQDDIHAFFNDNKGKQFLEYDENDKDYTKRIKYIHLFNENGRPNIRKPVLYIGYKIKEIGISLQKRLGIDLCQKYNYAFKKGNANWSITDDLVEYILSKKEEIKKIYKHSYCADEIYLHTLVYNSSLFRERVYLESGKTSNARKQQWDRIDNCYVSDDVESLVMSQALFARKFSGEEGERAIKKVIFLRNRNLQ